jgi:YVTN family beta-propeller protein
MSLVYRAQDLRLGRRVALKLMSAELAQDERFRKRFLAESRLAASIDHPGILPIYEAGEADGRLFIAMRYVEGADLGVLLRQGGRLQPDRAVRIVSQLARALDVAHRHGLVHRDVKPSNALVAEADDEHIYLADFGLTRHVTSMGDTAADQMVGTVDYISPEQIRGDAVDGRADVYSLGCVLFECLTGEVPFVRTSDVAVIYAHLEDEPPRLSERCAGLPAALDAVMGRALDKDPAQRFQTAGELAGAAQAALGAPRGVGATAARRSRLSRRVMAAAGAAVLAVASAAVLLMLGSGSDRLAVARIDANSVAVIDPSNTSLTAQVPMRASPARLASGEGAVWATNTDEQTVSRIDPATHTMRQTIDVGSGPVAIAAGEGGVWAVNGLDGTVSWISPATNRVVKTIPVGNGPAAVCVGSHAVWVANTDDRTVVAIDPDTGRVTGTIPLDGAPGDLACGDRTVWASSESAGTVVEIDPARRRVVRSIDVGAGAGAMAVGAGGVWLANSLAGVVSKIDPRRGVVTATIPMGAGDGPSAVAIGGGGVWIANQFAGTIARIDPARATVVHELRVGNSPQDVAFVGAALWVGLRASGARHRGGTLRVNLGVDFTFTPSNLDPADPFASGSVGAQILSLTNDGLTAFRRAGGTEGTKVVPDLAVALPAPTDGGRTYTFRMRSGIRYSSGQLVRPGDIRRGLKRLLQAANPTFAQGFYAGIVGAASCTPHRCDLSRGIVVDDASGTITFHLTQPDPEFLIKLALHYAAAIAAAGSPRGHRGRPPPATGPYVLGSTRSRSVFRFVRNPHFREWSRAAKPDGYADVIEIHLVGDAQRAVGAVERGAADYASGSAVSQLPRGDLDELFTRYVGQLHENPQPQTTYLFLNTRVAPFDRLAVRQAANYAIDRRAAVAIAGGPRFAQPTCQILPPSFPAYRPYCPYTADAGPGRPWTAPDLSKARRLIARSHTRGMRITVVGPPELSRYANLAVHVLDDLGYRATLRVLTEDEWAAEPTAPRHNRQVGVQSWLADFPTASDFLGVIFRCPPDKGFDLNYSEFCTPHTENLTSGALRVQTTNETRADKLWTSVDRHIVDSAAAVPLFNPKLTDVVSQRVGNYQHNPQWGVLLDQLWVR